MQTFLDAIPIAKEKNDRRLNNISSEPIHLQQDAVCKIKYKLVQVEATQVDISTKIPGRVIEIAPHEGDMVSPGEVVAGIDTCETNAQLHQAQASAELARQTLVTRQASVASDAAQLEFANKQLRRTTMLVNKGWSTQELLDQRNQQLKSADAALKVKAAQPQVDEARAAVKTADARVEELRAVVNDSTIKSFVQGRVQYRLVEPGAVLPPGGKIATVIDLSDVYTTVFLPAPQAGRLKVGNDPDAARIVLDAFPGYVFPASVSFVAPESQFTPKTVEVQSEREQLVFRVKLQKPQDDQWLDPFDRATTSTLQIGCRRRSKWPRHFDWRSFEQYDQPLAAAVGPSWRCETSR